MNDGRSKLTPEQASVLAAGDGNFQLMAHRLLSRESTDVEIAVIASVLASPWWPWTVKRNGRRSSALRYLDKRMIEGARVHALIQAGHSEPEAYKIADDEFRPDKDGYDLKRFRKAYREFKKVCGTAD